jgi:hypothetical protein
MDVILAAFASPGYVLDQEPYFTLESLLLYLKIFLSVVYYHGGDKKSDLVW